MIGQANMKTDTEIDTGRQTDRRRYSETDRLGDWEIPRQIDRQADRETDR